jgi:hypothetical protein
MQTPAPIPPLPLWRRVLRKVENALFGVAILLVCLYFILQLPVVQRWVTAKIAAVLSEELHTRVEVGGLNFSFFDHLVLEKVYVEDLHGDTLLYAGRLSAGLENNIFSVFGGQVNFNEISLQKTRVYLRRAEGERYNNLQFILDYLPKSKKKNSGPKKPFNLKIQNLYLDDVAFLQEDIVRGERMRVHVPAASVKLDDYDDLDKEAHIRSVTLDGLSFFMEEFPKKPLTNTAPALKDTLGRARTVSLRDTAQKRPMVFRIDRFLLSNGHFTFDKTRSTPDDPPKPEIMDYDHLNVRDIDLQLDSIVFKDDLSLTGQLKRLAAKDRCGFVLEHGAARSVIVNDTMTALYGMQIKTPQSLLGDTLVFRYKRYRDYRDFAMAVDMDLRFMKNSQLRLGDITYFSGPLYRNKFFATNRETIANLSGYVKGPVNHLSARDIAIHIGNNAIIEGNFSSDGLAEGKDALNLEFDFTRLQSDFQSIQKIIPGFSAPKNFDRLGRINYKGIYQIVFGYNHILDGELRSDIGEGRVNMSLNLTEGREKATYGGELDMHRFDLATWTGDKKFGKTAFNIKIDDSSSGLTLSSINARISGTIDTLQYRGYTYRKIGMNGLFERRIFDGKIKANDPNVSFDFDGLIDLRDSFPVMDFKADIERLDLEAINLMEKELVLSGRVEQIKFSARNWNALTGRVVLRGFRILEDEERVHRLDSLIITSNLRPDGSRFIYFDSDLADGSLEGSYDLVKTPRRLMGIFSKYYPRFATRLGLGRPDSLALTDRFDMRFTVRNTRQWTHLTGLPLDTLRDLFIKVHVEGDIGMTQILVEAPSLHYAGTTFKDASLSWYSLRDSATYNIRLPATRLSNKRTLSPLTIGGFLTDEALTFRLETKDDAQILQSVNLNGALSLPDSLWELRFTSSNISLFNQGWGIEENNYIRFGEGFIEANNFYLYNNYNQRIVVDNRNNGRGISLAFTNFDLSFVNIFLGSLPLEIRGKAYDVGIEVADVFKREGIQVYVNTDTVFIRNKSTKVEKPYGALFGFVMLPNMKMPVQSQVFLKAGKQYLRIEGAMSSGGDSTYTDAKFGTIKPEEFKATIGANEFPLDVVELFVPGISQTKGLFNADLQFSGPIRKPLWDGHFDILTGSLQMDYLKSSFGIKNQRVRFSNEVIWADGDTITDANGNPALVRRGLHHNRLRNWRIDCDVVSLNDRFQVLNTTKTDNDLYYGRAFGSFEAHFRGTFSRTDIDVDARTGKNTVLYIPFTTVADAKEVQFIKFKNKEPDPKTKPKNLRPEDLKGLNFELKVEMTEDAEVQMIFDEQAGDIIKGIGRGGIRMLVNREGEFKMYGNYEVRSGAYLFTLYNFVNKPFTVAPGGTISWTGDPYGAQINLDATYEANTSLYNLLGEEIQFLEATQPGLTQEARKGNRVIVTMHLKEDLMKPAISFDLAFPGVNPSINSVIESKMRLLRQDPNELNRQVFGLIVVGSFLPSVNSGFIQSSDYLNTAINTVTQMLTNQFSNYLSGLASEWFGSAVSSIDFEVGYNRYQNTLNLNGNGQAGTALGQELQVRLTSGFANDRITIRFGSQFGLGEQQPGTTVNSGFLGEDVTAEIQLTENKQWRLKIYQRTEPDFGGSGQRRARYGFGLNFRKDYDSFTDMIREMGSQMRRR